MLSPSRDKKGKESPNVSHSIKFGLHREDLLTGNTTQSDKTDLRNDYHSFRFRTNKRDHSLPVRTQSFLHECTVIILLNTILTFN